MINTAEKSRSGVLSNILLFVCLCILALRATHTESVNISSGVPWLNFGNELSSLLITGVLLVCVIMWLIRSVFQKEFKYHITSLEFSLILFMIAGAIGIGVASNKRAAINDYVTMVVPILTAVMLVHILDEKWKIRLTLAIIAALGCVSAYQCANQYFMDTHWMVEHYETDPQAMLQNLAIEQGSFEQWMFEHRLYTRGVNGFLMTGNSVASFSIFSVFAVLALLLERLKSTSKDNRGLLYMLMLTVAFIIVLCNFPLARSKGGTLGLIAAGVIFIILLGFRNFIRRHRTILFMVLMLCVAFGVSIVITYGQKQGRLPGGNSMLVRWQYWNSAIEMYRDNGITGVGPGNFGVNFTKYKDPAALEVVADPHNFILSILTQYGLLGIIAFASLLFAPVWKFITHSDNKMSLNVETERSNKKPIIFGVLIGFALLCIRPILIPVDSGGSSLAELSAGMAVIFIPPAAAFILCFLLIWFGSRGIKFSSWSLCALVCACIGVAAHNLLDFAIFEPGIYTTLWVVIACILALQNQNNSKKAITFKPNRIGRFIIVVICSVIFVCFWSIVFFPVANRSSIIARSKKAFESGIIDEMQVSLKRAAKSDALAPQPYLSSGKLYLQMLEYYGPKKKEILILAEKSLRQAAKRNPADFKPYEKLYELYIRLAKISAVNEKAKWEQKAFDVISEAVSRYPGSGRLRMKLAAAAESIGKIDLAIENYQKAIEIEDAYRKQFAIMYPGREVFSRLSPDKYEHAKSKVKTLAN